MNNRRLPLIILGVIGIIILMALSSSLFYTIQSNERAIIFYPFGQGLDQDNVIDQGTHWKAPWNDVYIYKVNEMSSDENMDILDKNGLSIHVDITVRYFISEKIGFVHQKFTQLYVDVLVIPEVRFNRQTSHGQVHSRRDLLHKTGRGRICHQAGNGKDSRC